MIYDDSKSKYYLQWAISSRYKMEVKIMFPIQPAIFKDDNEYWVRLVVDNVDPNEYLISSHANIYDFVNDKMIYPSNAQNGYQYVYLDNKDGKKRMPHLLHRLVAMSFVLNPSLEKDQVNHITGDKTKIMQKI